MENLNFIIGKNLTSLRKKNKLTQLELAQMLNYSDKAVSKWENGESYPSLELIRPLSEILNIGIRDLLGEKSESDKNDLHRVLQWLCHYHPPERFQFPCFLIVSAIQSEADRPQSPKLSYIPP